ncbi:HAD-IB family hydrolase [Candidatus Kaiserbacteria bacterium]|nr:HAD-IB family hydrolase [Candidatus Kaiserbacteria bacterium]
MYSKVAFFDIDGTLFRSSLLIELVEELIRAEIFPTGAEEVYQEAYGRWLNREGAYEEYIQAVIAAYMQHIRGVFYGDVADISRVVVATHGKRIYRYTEQLIQRLKKEGYYIVAISQSPKTVLDGFCAGYGFDKVYGRIYEIGPQDLFTGVVVDEHLIQNKANIVRRVVEQQGLSLAGSVGVGDTEGDISLFELVEQPICFNPNKTLYEHAKRMDWKVVVERKDVIYEL